MHPDSLPLRIKRARTPEDYLSRSLQELTVLDPEDPSEPSRAGNEAEVLAPPAVLNGFLGNKPGMLLRSDLAPSRVLLTFTGATRPMPPAKRDVLIAWANRFAGAVETYTIPYQTELGFTEDGTVFWLAIKTRDLPQFQQDARAHDGLEVLLLRLGACKEDAGWDWLLLIDDWHPRRTSS